MSENITTKVIEAFRDNPSIGILMSGTGTNAQALLDNPMFRDLYDVRAIVTDNKKSNASTIASEYELPYVEMDATGFESPKEREKYFDDMAVSLSDRSILAIVYAGFMKIATERFTSNFPGINVHPADLTIKNEDGLARYRGMHAMREMAADLGYVRATVHVVYALVDSGTPLSVSNIVPTVPNESNYDLHIRLKKEEHILFPNTLIELGKGSIDERELPISFPVSEKSHS